LICFNTTIECDQNIDYFSLHIIDDCTKAKDVITLSLKDGHCGIFYQVTSSISKNLDTVTIIEQSTSEWLDGKKSDFDTLFTTSYKINMKSKNLDTLQKTTTYQIIKQ